MDVKLGRVTYDPFAPAEKIKREEEKYLAQKEIGFRLSGLKVNYSNTSIYIHYYYYL